MFKNFSDYMWYLLHYPLKVKNQLNDIYILFNVIGTIFDDIKDTINLIHRQGNILTATGNCLNLLGNDRDMPRLKNENDENYRKRLLLKVEIAKRAGTKKGLELALNSLGYDEAKIKPVYEIYPERWAEFYVVLTEPPKGEIYEFDLVKKTIMDLKQASSKPNYIFKYPIIFDNNNIYDTKFCFKMGINFYGGEYLYFDNSWNLDNNKYLFNGIKKHGHFLTNNSKFNFKTTIINYNNTDLNNFKIKIPIKYNLANKLDVKLLLKYKINFYGGEYLYFDNTWDFNNKKYLFNSIKKPIKQKENTLKFKIKTKINTKIRLKSKVIIDSIWYLDGSCYFDDSRKFNSNITKEEF